MKLTRRARWAVPGVAVAVTAGTIAALQIPAAQAAPNLPDRTPAQLLASVSSEAKVPPLTGTVVETAALGLPQLPQASDPSSLSSLITGSHTVKVYYQDATHFRLAVPQAQSETDAIADGQKLWLWQSNQNKVTEFTPPPGKLGAAQAKLPATTMTPQQAANQVLQAVGATTLVSVQDNVMVAGQPSYQLALAPKDSRSLVGRVVIAVDGKYGVPLRVQLFAKGSASPAFQVGYTDLNYVSPNPANFAFTPPSGASVDVVKLPAAHSAPGGAARSQPAGVGSYGQSWLTVVSFPQADLTKGFGAGSGKQSDAYSAGGQGVGVSPQELMSALLGSAKTVHGSWGTGSLVTTSLVSVLITGGKVYVGAVQPSVLYAAVGHTAP